MATRTQTAAVPKKRTFHQELVLNRWVLGFFHGGTLAAIKSRIADDRFEGIDEDGQTQFFHELTRGLFDPNKVPEKDLRRYDLNIVAHWQAITNQRNQREGHALQMKYFQYLSLLFSELYLDWYFNKRQALLNGLNAEMALYRSETGALVLQDFVADELNKVAFWSATGSGKTLLLHVNIKQYLHYFQNGRHDHCPDKIILLTPNEGLSAQHLTELHLSGFGFAQPFNKTQKPPKGTIEIIDINKLGDEMGEKTVAVDAFEGNNLVLVDEGHRGTGTAAGAWMARREALVRGGFAFEYSATFGQAVAKGRTIAEEEEEFKKAKAKMLFGTSSLKKLAPEETAQLSLTLEDKRRARIKATKEVYAKCILFDYSYKYFYADGYGKESLILNMDGDAYELAENAQKYFTACLLSYYQQMWLWETSHGQLTEFNIEKPLWVFVGNTVTGEDSDVLEVVNFLAFFLNKDDKVKAWLADLIADKAQILDAKRNNIFHNRFTPLMGFLGRIDDLYADVLQRVFNAPSRQRLKLVNIRASKGELALRVGDAEPFGLINIGDDAGFFSTAENAKAFENETDEFGGPLFGTLNNMGSKLNVLIGSKKFTEGWSSWRVSTMGLLNMGQGEGSQIIQLFGRGVRLKGKCFSLKRSTPHERPKGLNLELLETLNIFGVRANYMNTFKDYLVEEGIVPFDEILELDFETRANLPASKLKTLALKDGYKDNQKLGFKRTHYPLLYEVPAPFLAKIKPAHVVLDLYPRVAAMASKDRTLKNTEAREEGKLNPLLFTVFDWDRIYLAVMRFKLQRSWSNLRLDMQKLRDFAEGPSTWYTLFVPSTELAINSFADVRKQEDILIQLLCDYTDRFYKTLKNAYEGQFYDVVTMSDEHGSMLKLYHFAIEDSPEGHVYKQKLEVLQKLVRDGKIGDLLAPIGPARGHGFALQRSRGRSTGLPVLRVCVVCLGRLGHKPCAPHSLCRQRRHHLIESPNMNPDLLLLSSPELSDDDAGAHGIRWGVFDNDVPALMGRWLGVAVNDAEASSFGMNDPVALGQLVAQGEPSAFALLHTGQARGEGQAGLMALIHQDPGGPDHAPRNALWSAFPFFGDGRQVLAEVEEIGVFPNRIEARLRLGLSSGAVVFAFDTGFVPSRAVYRAGASYRFVLSALAYDMGPAQSLDHVIDDADEIRRFHARNAWAQVHDGWTPEDEAASLAAWQPQSPEDLEPIHIHLGQMAVLLPSSTGPADDAQFVGEVVQVTPRAVRVLDVDFWRVDTVVIRAEEDVVIPIYVAEHAFEGDWRPEVGQYVTGSLWLQAYAHGLENLPT